MARPDALDEIAEIGRTLIALATQHRAAIEAGQYDLTIALQDRIGRLHEIRDKLMAL
jgi:hypothetical protein